MQSSLIDVYSIFISFYKPHIICLGAQKSHLGETVLRGILVWLKEQALLSIIGRSG